MDEKVPWWGQVKQMVWTLGPVTVGFFLFIFVQFGWLPSPMMTGIQLHVTLLEKNQRIMTEMRDSVQEHTRTYERERTETLKALRQICRNTAKNETQRERCDEMHPN